MDQVTLRASARTELGTRPSRRLRREGKVPAVVYGAGLDPMTVAVDGRDLYATLHTEAGSNAIFDLDVDGTNVLAVAREIQRDPVRGDITHLDFIQIRLDVEIEAEVGIEFVGEPVGVRDDGGFLETIQASLMISALPNQIPSSISADVSHLGVGDVISIADLPEIEGVTYLGEPDRPLAVVALPRAELEEEEVAEGEELLEGEEPGEEAAEAAASEEE
jgi:large subunit ribosomal protein L25